MNTPRISASSYSNTAPLIWSFLYGANHGKVEIILDNAPARSAELLSQNRVDAALVPVIAYQFIENARLVPGVCVGARERVRSVCLLTKGGDLKDVRSVALDVSSRTSVTLTKIIFREFLGFEPEWKDAKPDIDAMLAESDAALLIGDPALSIGQCSVRDAEWSEQKPSVVIDNNPHRRPPPSGFKAFDLAELWREHTGLGFVFAMWMTKEAVCPIDFAAARDEGLAHIEEIISNYQSDIGLNRREMRQYLSENISYSPDESMLAGMELYFKLAAKHGLGGRNVRLAYVGSNL